MITKVRTKKKVVCFLGLGSNLGERHENIQQAVKSLEAEEGIQVTKVSGHYETMPVGMTSQPKFINACCEVQVTLSPEELLDRINRIEARLGRRREVEMGPRTIDIDILMFGGLIMSEDGLQIPHPMMHERLFVLEPLKEIAPELVHPCIGITVSELYDTLALEMDLE